MLFRQDEPDKQNYFPPGFLLSCFFIYQVNPVILSKIFFISWEIRVTAPE